MSAATLRPASDSDLLRHGAAGHENSYDELEARHRAALASYTQQLTGDTVAAELLVERSFAELRERAAADPNGVGAVRPFLLASASTLHGVTSDAPPPAIRWDPLDSVSQTALWHLDVEGDSEEVVSLLVGIDVEYVPAVAAAARYAVGDMPSGASADLRQRLTSYLLGSAADHFLETHGGKPATTTDAAPQEEKDEAEPDQAELDQAETPAPVLTLVRSPEPEATDLEVGAEVAAEIAEPPVREPVTPPAATVAQEVRRPDPLSDPLTDPFEPSAPAAVASAEAASAEEPPAHEAPVELPVEAPAAAPVEVAAAGAGPLAPAAAVQAAFDVVRPRLPVHHPDDFSDLMELALGRSAAAQANPEPAEAEQPAATVEPEFTPLDEPEPIKLVAPYPLNVPARSFRYAGGVYDDLADEDTIIHPLDSPKSNVVELSSRRRTTALLAIPLAIAGVLVVVGLASAALLLSSPPTPARLDSVSSGTDGEAGVWALVPGQTLKARQARHSESAYTPSSSPTSAATSAATSASTSESPSANASQTAVQSSWPTASHSPSHSPSPSPSPSPTHSTSPTTSPTPTQSPNPSDSSTASPSSSSSPTASDSSTAH